jgi:magnesium transporter
LDAELQKKILERLSSEEASQLVTHMDSDDAADLLGQLPAEESKDILENLEKEESHEVVDLMTYPEDSAGGIMSSDHAAFTEDITVEQAIQALQGEEMENKVTFYIYVVNSSGQLVGVVSLKQLLLSKKSATMRALMHPSVISVRVDTHQEQVAKTVERYDFLSLPVIDESNKLVGVITVDDVIDVIRAEAEEDLLAMGQAGWGVDMTLREHFLARLPWQVMAFVTGCVCFGLIYWFGIKSDTGVHNFEFWSLTAYIPLLLALGAMVGNQSVTVMVGALRTGNFIGGRMRNHILRELFLSVIFSLIFGAAVWLLAQGFLPLVTWHMKFVGALMLQIVVSICMGVTLPLLMDRLKLDPTVATVPLLTALADITAIVILFGLFAR